MLLGFPVLVSSKLCDKLIHRAPLHPAAQSTYSQFTCRLFYSSTRFNRLSHYDQFNSTMSPPIPPATTSGAFSPTPPPSSHHIPPSKPPFSFPFSLFHHPPTRQQPNSTFQPHNSINYAPPPIPISIPQIKPNDDDPQYRHPHARPYPQLSRESQAANMALLCFAAVVCVIAGPHKRM